MVKVIVEKNARITERFFDNHYKKAANGSLQFAADFGFQVWILKVGFICWRGLRFCHRNPDQMHFFPQL